MATDEFTGGLTGELERAPGALVYRLTGDADVSAADALRARLLEVLAEGPGDLVVDLTRVAFMDSSALGALLTVSFAAREAGRHVVALRPSPAVLQLLELTGVEGVLETRRAPDPG